MNEKKAIPLRISPELWKELRGWAEQDMRSLNGQIELILREAVRARNQGSTGQIEAKRKAG
jgi:hypothetical protein